MTDFKEYVNRNPEILDDLELPEGHEERFEAKLDALLNVGHVDGTTMNATPERHRRLIRAFSVLTAAAAAVIAAVIFINRPAGEVDWFADVVDDPTEVYLTYSEKATSMYREILTKDIDGKWGITIGSVAEETVPMIDLLPEEMDDAAKAEVLKDYYGKLLNGLDKINKIKEL